MTNVQQGDRVWIPHDEHAWICGTVAKLSDTEAQIISDVGPITMKPKNLQGLDFCGRHVDDNVENLVDLDELSEGAILYHIRKRYMNDLIYTHVGAILVAVNPFQRLGIYGDRDMKRASNVSNTYPHIFISASIAYQQLSVNMKNQSVLISGESGAGKTETTKKVLNYLASVAPGTKNQSEDASIEDKILQSNPLLEALGNSKTLRNNNSSRFGKWMKVYFDHSFHIDGCEVVNYLLEKSRIVSQSPSERNYHMFYLLLAGADSMLRERCNLLAADQFMYLNQTGCYSIEGVDDAADFEEVCKAMNTLCFAQELQDSIMKLIAAILHIGNIQFDAGVEEGTSEVSADSASHVDTVIDILGLDRASFLFALTEKTVQMGRGSVVGMKLSAAQALDSKDTLSKALYSNLFDWIIRKINDTLRTAESPFYIGILDIFGYEVFDVNSFEQLCINYANEKLQFHFNDVIFSEEMKMYEGEGIPADHIDFVDNALCVELIEHRLMGLLSLLDEECSLGKATDATYANKIEQAFGKNRPNENPFYERNKTRPEAFTVKHFAGDVEYVVTNFLDKNRDAISSTLQDVAASSSVSLVSDLFTPTTETTQSSNRRSTKSASKSTLGGQFRNQLIGLLGILQETEPHFVRCVKPNHQKKPNIFDGALTLRQLRYAGLFEAIRIRQSGYAYRVTHGTFVRQFITLVDGLYVKIITNQISHAEAALYILDQCTLEGIIQKGVWHVGKTKVFIKANSDRVQLERQRLKRVEIIAIRLQAFIRGCIVRRRTWKHKHEKIRKQRELEEAILMRSRAVVLIQKIVRGFICRKTRACLNELVTLRSELSQRGADKAEMILEKIKRVLIVSDLPMAIQRELAVAQTMIKLIRIQDHCLKNIKKSLEQDDENVLALEKLISMAERLDLSRHPLVEEARSRLTQLDQKKSIMEKMVQFLRADDESVCEPIEDTLVLAKEMGVDEDFIAEVKMMFENTSPRLRARYRLRRSVETIDVEGLEDGIVEISLLQDHFPSFGEMELRAAKSLLRLIELEKCLTGKNFDLLESGGRLSEAVVKLCDEICDNFHNKNELKFLRFRLYKMCRTKDNFEMTVWAYKWARTFAVWKHSLDSDAVDALAASPTVKQRMQKSFFGLRMDEMRASGHVKRSLHVETDGDDMTPPPSIVAALDQLTPKKTPLKKNPPQRDPATGSPSNKKMSTTPKSTHRSPFNTFGATPDETFSTPPILSNRFAKTSPSPRKSFSPQSGRKGATHFLSYSEKKANIVGLKTEFDRLPPELEEALLESRSALERQKAAVSASKQKSNIHSPKKDWM